MKRSKGDLLNTLMITRVAYHADKKEMGKVQKELESGTV